MPVEHRTLVRTPERKAAASGGRRTAGTAAAIGDEVVALRLDALVLDGTPRFTTQNIEHARMIAGIDGDLPAILVHRDTMRVIDGVHRALAARMRGREHIAARYVDGGEEEAFLLAVRSNITHGLPLSLQEREAAAERILNWRPEWSDRAIATAAGLSATTVAMLRGRRGAEEGRRDEARPGDRVGRDGRVRPLSAATGRIRASQVISDRPHASVREIAREAGISVGTAHNVRERLANGLDPVPSNDRRRPEGRSSPRLPGREAVLARGRIAGGEASLLSQLRLDPSLRYTEQGRFLLRWMDAHLLDEKGWETVVDAVPDHRATDVAALALSLADQWRSVARRLACKGQASA